ncbi:uncharacterized protein [Amphiura filiformis]|uniref:uncharacterized protein isoform X2 n=1 Tax=Amphiura filiformis TaxID=82378 RepID=UPI003B2101B3
MSANGSGEPETKKAKCNVPEGVLLGIGNPLLDISATVDEAFLKKYELDANNQILAEDKHKPMFQELVDNYKVDYIPGGATQNTIRVASWINNVPKMASFFGCIAKDNFGDILKTKMEEFGVHVDYRYDEKEPTGTCAVAVTGKDRSLVANLAAANCYKKDHLVQPKNWAMVEKAAIFYCAGFHLTVAPDAMLALAEHAKENNKIFSMNLSAPFLSQFFKDPQMKVLPYCDYVFGNETEAAVFAKEQNFGTEDLKEIALKIAALPKENDKRPCVAIITQGEKATLVAQGGKVHEFPVIPIKDDDVVDTNGAGDAFVGGFLAQLAQDKSLEECIRCAHFAANYIIQRNGITMEGTCSYE